MKILNKTLEILLGVVVAVTVMRTVPLTLLLPSS